MPPGVPRTPASSASPASPIAPQPAAPKTPASGINQARMACGVPQCSGVGGAGGGDPNDPNADPAAAGGCGCQAVAPDGKPLSVSCDDGGCECADDQAAFAQLTIPNVCASQQSLEAAFAKCCLN
jgi:hypothetical protein